MNYLRYLLFGIYFGILLVKAEVASWERINKMFLFQEAHMYLIICTAIVVGAISMWLIRRFEVTDNRQRPIVYQPKPYHKGVILGGMIFGAGWAITGACPGPIFAQIGSGQGFALFTFAGAMVGAVLHAYLKPKLPH